jgi:hypothetical protein
LPSAASKQYYKIDIFLSMWREKKYRSKDTKKGGHLGKNHAPLLQVKWSVPNYNFEFVDTTEGGAFYNGTRRIMFLEIYM